MMQATWLQYTRFRNRQRCYRSDVRVLEVRKHTARIEARRYDGSTVRRFVKLDRLSFSQARAAHRGEGTN